MASLSQTFLLKIGEELTHALKGNFTFHKTNLELRRPVPEGHDVLRLAGSNKYSPYINISFYYGKNYRKVAEIEKKLKTYRFPYHVQQYSSGRQKLYAPVYVGRDNWDADISNPPPDLIGQIVTAVHGMAEPFFANFSSMERARDHIANNSNECFSGSAYWHQLLEIDLAIGDLAHFQQWRHSLNDLQQQQADDFIKQYMQVYSAV